MKTFLLSTIFLLSLVCQGQSLNGDITKLKFLNQNSDQMDFSEMRSLLRRLNPQSAVGGNVSGGGGNVSGGSNSRVIYNGSTEDVNLIKSYQISQMGLLGLHQKGYDGKKHRAVIIDSGINPQSQAVKQVYLFKDFTSECVDSMCDLSGHGSLVADLVVQAAPSASLIILKVLSENTKGDFSHVVKALKWVLSNYKSQNIKVLNMSLMSADRVYGYYNEVDEARDLVRRISEKGILIVSAVGNDYKKKSVDLFPASAPEVLSVGSYSHEFSESISSRRLSPFSNFGMANQPSVKHSSFLWITHTEKDFRRWSFKPELLAPGENILACNNSCEFVSGTSFASALITGGILSMLDKESDLNRDKILQSQERMCNNPLLSFDGRNLWKNVNVCGFSIE